MVQILKRPELQSGGHDFDLKKWGQSDICQKQKKSNRSQESLGLKSHDPGRFLMVCLRKEACGVASLVDGISFLKGLETFFSWMQENGDSLFFDGVSTEKA